MPRGVQWVLGIALAVVLTIGLGVGATVHAAYNAGSIEVHFQPRDGGDIHVAVPAAAANLAIAAVDLVPAGTWPDEDVPQEALDAIDQYLPVVEDALKALAEQPDFVLVEVESRDEHVIVEKRGRKLVVTVDEADGRIKVSLPLSTVKEFGKALKRLARD